MITESELREKLDSLQNCISKPIEILDRKVSDLNMASEGLQGLLTLRLHHVKASVIIIPQPEGKLTVEVWRDFRSHKINKRFGIDEIEMLTHLEAAAAFWMARVSGTTGRVYHVPKPLIAELWIVPKDRLDFVVSKCEQLPTVHTVTRTEMHVVVMSRGTKWRFIRPDMITDNVAVYAARTKGGLSEFLCSGLCSREIRNCLVSIGATRIR